VGNTAFVVGMIVVAAFAAWPIYADWTFLVLVIASAVLGFAISTLATARRFGLVLTAALVVGVYLVFGVPLAVPSALTGLTDVLTGWVSLVGATVFSWKQLATISTIPVGSYQTLLVPAFLVFLVGTTLLTTFALRGRRWYPLVVPVALLMCGFGLLFGAADVSPDIVVGSVAVHAPRELAVGALAFFVALGFLLWRVAYERRLAIRQAQSVAGIRQSRQATASVARRFLLAATTLVLAALVAVVLTPALSGSAERRVLRSTITPETLRTLADSPLSDFRSFYSDDLYGQELFSVSTDGLDAAELRLAVLSYYDGQTFTAVDPITGGTPDSAFVRVPYTVDPGVDGERGSATVTVGEGYSGAWVPTLRNLEQLTFAGDNARENAAAFFYNRDVQAGIESDGIRPGDSFDMTGVNATVSADALALGPAADISAVVGDDLVPDALVQWVNMQQTTDLAELVRRLRARGYLSHAILDPGAESAWIEGIYGGDTGRFAPSYAGHSSARIGTLFTQLVQKQRENPDGDDAAMVAGIGDDEQFAVAAALVAQHLGYPSRVVLGFRLADEGLGPDDVPACTDACRGQNAAAWIEVQVADGGWVPIDTTPQHTQPLAVQQVDQQLPRYGTGVDPESATKEQPSAGDQSTGDTSTAPEAETAVDLAWLSTTLRIVGLSLLGVLVLLAPFATILFAKARRRRERRRAERIEQRIVGGWDEYVDAALDHGYDVPTTETRTQVAQLYRTTNGTTLAQLADRAVFGPSDPDPAESERFWQILEEDRVEFARGMNAMQRWRAAVSLRSFTRYLRGRIARTGG
jgi:transglutaminase-like putative cysteine protease